MPAEPKPMFFIISVEELLQIEAVMKRLYTEDRMDGDEMRDSAQTLNGVVDGVKKFPWTGE